MEVGEEAKGGANDGGEEARGEGGGGGIMSSMPLFKLSSRRRLQSVERAQTHYRRMSTKLGGKMR
jgi:hypothetical protein